MNRTMQRMVMPAIVLMMAAVLLLTSPWILLSLRPDSVSAATTKVLTQFSSPIATATSSTSTSVQSSIDPTVLVALIGIVGGVLVALIAGAFALYQVRRNAEIERIRQAEQFRHDQEMERLRKELEAQYRAKEQEEQREETKAEALRLKMLLAQTNAERAKAYRQAVHADPRISRLQILDMSRPLEVASIYVRVRIHQDVRPGYKLDPETSATEGQRDPNALIQASFKYLEGRASNSIEPDEAVRTYRHCIILGDPGAGKTTLLKYLTLKSADNQLIGLPDLPIRVELNAFASSGYQDLLDFAATDWEEHYNFPKADARIYMEENLKVGKALLLLDALDETVIGEDTKESEASYFHVADAIALAMTRYHQSPIVVTARKAGYQQRAPLVGFTELEVLEFRPEDMRQFIKNWFDNVPSSQQRKYATELNAKLTRNPRIQALAANPLLLSLIVLVYEAQLDLPDRRAELYKRCVDTLLTEWDAKRNIRRRREFKPEHKRQLLAELAWHFHLQGRRYFPENEVLAVIADFLPKVRLLPEQNGQVLAEIANEQGLLKEQARGWQGFLHLTLQEYFVAQYVTDHQELVTLLSHRGDPWWEEVLLLYAGYVPDASPLLEKLLEQNAKGQLRDDIFQTNLMQAGRCLVARPTIQQISLWETVITHLFEALTTIPYSLIREQSAEILAAIGGTEVNKRLLQIFSDKQFSNSGLQRIAEALAASGERSIVLAMVDLLTEEDISKFTRAGIAEALGISGEQSIVINFVQLLSNEQLDVWIRENIAIALGNLGECSVLPDLVNLLSDRKVFRDVRVAIATALGNLGERSVLPDLVNLLPENDDDQSLYNAIVMAICNLKDPSTAPFLVGLLSNTGPRSNRLLSVNTLNRIAIALGNLGDRSSVPALKELLFNENVAKQVRWNIALALGMLGESSIISTLLQLLSDEQVDQDACENIATTLAKLGDRSVISDLLRLLYNKQIKPSVRLSIASAIGGLGEHIVPTDMMQVLSSKQFDLSIRWYIVSALGKLEDLSTAFDLVQLLSDKQVDRSVRLSVAEALGKLVNDEIIISALASLLPLSDIKDVIHRALWTASHRVGVRIFVIEGVEGETQVEIVKL